MCAVEPDAATVPLVETWLGPRLRGDDGEGRRRPWPRLVRCLVGNRQVNWIVGGIVAQGVSVAKMTQVLNQVCQCLLSRGTTRPIDLGPQYVKRVRDINASAHPRLHRSRFEHISPKVRPNCWKLVGQRFRETFCFRNCRVADDKRPHGSPHKVQSIHEAVEHNRICWSMKIQVNPLNSRPLLFYANQIESVYVAGTKGNGLGLIKQFLVQNRADSSSVSSLAKPITTRAEEECNNDTHDRSDDTNSAP